MTLHAQDPGNESELVGEFDDPRTPREFTIATRDISNTTEWITTPIEHMVWLEEVR
jgi:hypothetical protein